MHALQVVTGRPGTLITSQLLSVKVFSKSAVKFVTFSNSCSSSNVDRARHIIFGSRKLGIASNPLFPAQKTSRITTKALEVGKDLQAVNLTPSPEVLDIWRTADAVCFDVDSTVCVDEGIDELAAFCGAGEAVAAWTTQAMTGSVKFEDALAARLSLIEPSLETLTRFLAEHPPRLSPGIEEVVRKLHARGAHVYLVSGGFRQMIEPAAALLSIPLSRIFANRLLFDEATGDFAGFDRNEPTSRSGGKPLAIELLKKEHGYKRLVMLGDGATDLEARRPGAADAFIGYGGVQVRPTVAAGADWFVYSFDALIEALS